MSKKRQPKRRESVRQSTGIEWANETCNPVHGCYKVSPGCAHCYAERVSLKFGFTPTQWTQKNLTANLRYRPEALEEPYKMAPGTICFMGSMSDLFLPELDYDYRQKIWKVMNDNLAVTFVVLTKRGSLLREWPGPWSHNIWMGVSVEDANHWHRVDDLLQCGAHTRLISYEPALGPLGQVDLTGIDWIIAGGESGPKHRPFEMAWAWDIRDQCVEQQTAFFFKQISATKPGQHPYIEEEDGRHTFWRQYPKNLVEPECLEDDPVQMSLW